ncbi:hypothetical protein Q4577_15955 [Marinovum sp. 2_MG-2023]|uniref:hypothetical protein n=1 Tax=unclassified Marinovum TaxID=2647166 RepID=UPI0026E37FA5|nr:MULTISPECIES: hypothetical protein [unclassified Marinovum]MDO6731529.1 hypothetical protein [Marinovum sp. 2_MG-2023]MDO6780889.1 hypothetical protein [Marinovum sp. 1_MG-2023]
MDTDLALVIGSFIAILAVPSIISALSDGRAPRAAAIAVLVGGGLIVFAITGNPGGYTVDQLPEVFYRVVGRFI